MYLICENFCTETKLTTKYFLPFFYKCYFFLKKKDHIRIHTTAIAIKFFSFKTSFVKSRVV